MCPFRNFLSNGSYDFMTKTACIVNGMQLQADLSGSRVRVKCEVIFSRALRVMGNVVGGSSAHKIKTHDRIIEVGVSECSSEVGAVGISNYNGFLHECLFAVVQLEF